jgi:cytochrome P450
VFGSSEIIIATARKMASSLLGLEQLTTANLFNVGMVVACLVATILIALQKLFPRNLPPGPKALPIIGNMPSLFPDPAIQISKWSKQYGDTMSLQYGRKLLVVMHDFDTAKAIFNDDNTTARDPDYPQNTFAKGRGIQQAEGELWREQRRFMTRTLREYGMGKSWLEEAFLQEIEDSIRLFSKHEKDPVDPRGYIEHYTANMISRLTFGKRYEIDNQAYNRFTKAFADNTRLLGPPLTPVYLYPITKYIIPQYRENWRRFYSNWSVYLPFVKKQMEERKQYVKSTDAAAENYVDSFFEEAKKQQVQGVVNSTFTDDQLLYTMINMYTAGTASVTTTLLWCFLYMLENPEEQKKVQEELDSVAVPGKFIRIEDKPSLKYTEAVLLEIQRCASIVPLGLFHQNFEEMTIDGYSVPKRTLLSANIFSIHRDPRYWKYPNKFYPGHFLDEKGNLNPSPKGFMPFGIGKRFCNGDQLARMELFLYFTNMLHRFEFRVAEGHPVSSEKFTTGLARATAPFEALFIPRFKT